MPGLETSAVRPAVAGTIEIAKLCRPSNNLAQAGENLSDGFGAFLGLRQILEREV